MCENHGGTGGNLKVKWGVVGEKGLGTNPLSPISAKHLISPYGITC